jgi:hypothetical protein
MTGPISCSIRLAGMLALSAFGLSACASKPTPPANAEIPTGLTKAELAAVTDAVKRQLQKPDAAELKWLTVPDSARGSSQTVLVYCGLVNAMTAPGLYTGFRPYYAIVVTEKDGTAVADVLSPASDSASDHSQPARLACTEAGYKLP